MRLRNQQLQRVGAFALAIALWGLPSGIGLPPTVGGEAHAQVALYSSGNSARCVTTVGIAGPIDDRRQLKNTCSFPVQIGYCVAIRVGEPPLLGLCEDRDRMVTLTLAAGAQGHGGQILDRFDSYRYGACRKDDDHRGIASSAVDDFQCHE